MHPSVPFPRVIDSTILSTYSACHHKAFLEYILHYKPANPSIHLHAGGAFAKSLEVCRKAFFEHGLSDDAAMEKGLHALITFYGDFVCPPDSSKSLERMMGAYEYYHDQYPMTMETAVPATLPSGTKAVEFSFAEPTDVMHPVTGDPILYVGRMDQVVEYAGGLYGEDDKTTSQLGASWSKHWDLRGQFTGYCWGAAKAGLPLNGFLIRGISILKTKYETQQALTYRQPWQIDQWYEITCRKIESMIRDWQTGVWDQDLADACGSYGGCLFRQICMSREPAPWLEANFVRRVWDPVAREETLL